MGKSLDHAGGLPRDVRGGAGAGQREEEEEEGGGAGSGRPVPPRRSCRAPGQAEAAARMEAAAAPAAPGGGPGPLLLCLALASGKHGATRGGAVPTSPRTVAVPGWVPVFPLSRPGVPRSSRCHPASRPRPALCSSPAMPLVRPGAFPVPRR